MRLVLFAFLLGVFLAPAAHAGINAVTCPVSDGKSFKNFDVYDLSGGDKDYLIPDEDGYNLDASHIEGHKIFLACHYSDGSTRELPLPGNLDVCSEINDNVVCR